ncbi:MAG: hypothetical protein ACOH1L_00710 [Thermomonas sp.]
MSPNANDAVAMPMASPDPTDYPGYAETKPCTKEQAQIPGAKQPPGTEDGGLEHQPDPAT